MSVILLQGNGTGGAVRRTPPFFKTKKLALIGNTDSVVYAPWHDPSWTIASHTSSRMHCKREPDWYFDMHRPECFTQSKSWNRRYYDWLKRLQTPIFMQEEWPEIPAAVRYPIERILSEFRPHFTNHVAYMIALAMTEGVTHLGLFGCQYAADSEYGVQRDSCLYWMGRFEQAGGVLTLPPKRNTLLCSPKGLYGYESHDEHGKLVPEYRSRKVVASRSEDAPAPAMTAMKTFQVDEDTADGRIPLMPMPNGEKTAWERSGLKIHA